MAEPGEVTNNGRQSIFSASIDAPRGLGFVNLKEAFPKEKISRDDVMDALKWMINRHGSRDKGGDGESASFFEMLSGFQDYLNGVSNEKFSFVDQRPVIDTMAQTARLWFDEFLPMYEALYAVNKDHPDNPKARESMDAIRGLVLKNHALYTLFENPKYYRRTPDDNFFQVKE